MGESMEKFITIFLFFGLLSPGGITFLPQPKPFKCIFDPYKTLFELIPGHLIVQELVSENFGQVGNEWEPRNLYKSSKNKSSAPPILQPVDCFIIVKMGTVLKEPGNLIEKPNVSRPEKKGIPVTVTQNQKNNVSDDSERSELNKIRRNMLKRLMLFEHGMEKPIFYRSIKEDKEQSKRKYPKTTKIVKSQKVSESVFQKDASKWKHMRENTIPSTFLAKRNTNDTILLRQKRTISAQARVNSPIQYRSITNDKKFGKFDHPKTTKVVKSKAHAITTKIVTSKKQSGESEIKKNTLKRSFNAILEERRHAAKDVESNKVSSTTTEQNEKTFLEKIFGMQFTPSSETTESFGSNIVARKRLNSRNFENVSDKKDSPNKDKARVSQSKTGKEKSVNDPNNSAFELKDDTPNPFCLRDSDESKTTIFCSKNSEDSDSYETWGDDALHENYLLCSHEINELDESCNAIDVSF